jgi:hypothetical protein
MSWPGFHAPAGAWLFALLGPLVLFYFLKLKRTRLRVPSLALWRQVMQDRRVNAPFQRFKRNLLLLLQILALVLVVLGAMQPYRRGAAARARRLPVLIDCSASMGAFDEAGGVTRLEAARRRVSERIDGLLPDQQLCLIAFSRTARKLTGFTNNRRVLRDALDRLTVEDVPSDIEDALRVTQALGQSVAFDRALLLSDGNLPERTDFGLSFEIEYVRLPPAGPNLGVVSLNARRAGEGGWDVFANIEASSQGEMSAAVVFAVGEGEEETRAVTVSRRAAERVVFRVETDRPTTVTVRLVPDGFDALAADNRAALALPDPRPLKVYVSPRLAAWRHALRRAAGVRVYPRAGEADDGGGAYDLVVTDRPDDLERGAAVHLGVGVLPPALERLVVVDDTAATVVDWRRNAPLLQHVELGDVDILRRPRLREGVTEGDLENLGYEVLAWGGRGPLVVRRRGETSLAYALLFHTDRSTLPYRIGFPILVANAARVALGEAGLAEAHAFRTGVLPPLAVPADTPCRVRGPDGAEREARSDARGRLRGVPAPRAGAYTVTPRDGAPLRVAAGLLDAGETGLQGLEKVEFDEGLTVEASAVAPRTDRALWGLVAFAALCVLTVEWWFFQRRPGGRRP